MRDGSQLARPPGPFAKAIASPPNLAAEQFIPAVAVVEFRVAVAAVDLEVAAASAARQAAVAAAWRAVPRALEQVFLQGQAWESALGPVVQAQPRPLARGRRSWGRLSRRKSFSNRGKANAPGAA